MCLHSMIELVSIAAPNHKIHKKPISQKCTYQLDVKSLVDDYFSRNKNQNAQHSFL